MFPQIYIFIEATFYMKLIHIFIFSLLIFATCSQSLYKLIKHSKERGAACLDGSPAAMYLHEGSGLNKDKFLMYFMGGGFCGDLTLNSTIENCYNRSQTLFGSSNDFPLERDFDSHGILAAEE